MVSNSPTTLHVGESLRFACTLLSVVSIIRGRWTSTLAVEAEPQDNQRRGSAVSDLLRRCACRERGNLPASGELDLAFQIKCTKTRWHEVTRCNFSSNHLPVCDRLWASNIVAPNKIIMFSLIMGWLPIWSYTAIWKRQSLAKCKDLLLLLIICFYVFCILF